MALKNFPERIPLHHCQKINLLTTEKNRQMIKNEKELLVPAPVHFEKRQIVQDRYKVFVSNSFWQLQLLLKHAGNAYLYAYINSTNKDGYYWDTAFKQHTPLFLTFMETPGAIFTEGYRAVFEQWKSLSNLSSNLFLLGIVRLESSSGIYADGNSLPKNSTRQCLCSVHK